MQKLKKNNNTTIIVIGRYKKVKCKTIMPIEVFYKILHYSLLVLSF